MRKRISAFISLFLALSSSLLFLLPAPAWAQKKDKEQLKADYKASPFYQGSSVGVEIAGIGGYLLGGDILSSEIILQSNLKNRFLPTLEIGYGKTDVVNDANDMHYKTSAPYFRIGMDYNVFYLKPYLPGYLYVGLRYGMSSFSYDVSGTRHERPQLWRHHRAFLLLGHEKQGELAGRRSRHQSKDIQRLPHGMGGALQDAHEHHQPRELSTLVRARIREKRQQQLQPDL